MNVDIPLPIAEDADFVDTVEMKLTKVVDMIRGKAGTTVRLKVQTADTGEVKALVAGPGFERSQFNLATQGGRQPGSTYKAITLAAALEDGYSVKDTISGSSPCTVKVDGFAPWTTRTSSSPAAAAACRQGR